MRLVSVSGTRGSGKTTLIGRLMAQLMQAGRRCAVIVNENGEVSYKEVAGVIGEDFPVAYLRGG